jgi:Ca-activated chloride channel family protein
VARLMRCKYCGTLQDEPQGVKLCAQCGGELAFLADDPWAGGQGSGGYVKAQLELDQIAAPAGQGVERYLALTIETPDAVPAGEQASGAGGREPMHFVAVLDTSGSMHGAKIDAAREAARHAVQRLQDGDLFSLVTFDTEVRCPLSARRMDANMRRVIASALGEVQSGGQTALCGGLEQGIAQAAAGAQATNLVLLLSDGQANVGLTDVEEEGRRALVAREQRITVSTIGVGSDYNEAMMAEIALDGGGRFYHIERASQIAAYLTGELGEMASLAARDVVVDLELPPGTGVQALSSAYLVRGSALSLGDIPVSTALEVIVRVLLPPQEAGVRLALGGKLRYESPAGHAFVVPLNQVTVRYDAQPLFTPVVGVVRPVMRRVLDQMHAASVLSTAKAATRGYAAAQQQSEVELSTMRQYAARLGKDGEAARVLDESEQALGAMAKPAPAPGASKAAMHAAMRVQRASKNFDNT